MSDKKDEKRLKDLINNHYHKKELDEDRKMKVWRDIQKPSHPIKKRKTVLFPALFTFACCLFIIPLSLEDNSKENIEMSKHEDTEIFSTENVSVDMISTSFIGNIQNVKNNKIDIEVKGQIKEFSLSDEFVPSEDIKNGNLAQFEEKNGHITSINVLPKEKDGMILSSTSNHVYFYRFDEFTVNEEKVEFENSYIHIKPIQPGYDLLLIKEQELSSLSDLGEVIEKDNIDGFFFSLEAENEESIRISNVIGSGENMYFVTMKIEKNDNYKQIKEKMFIMIKTIL